MGRPNSRDRIISAATEVFCQRGYGEATTLEISQRAGTAEVTLFRNFNTKKELYFEVLGQIRGHLSEVIESLKDKTNDDGTMLKILLVDRLTMVGKNSKLFGLMLHDMQYHDEVRKEFAGIHRDLLEALTDYLDRNFVKTTREEAAFAARYFIWLIMGSVINKNLFDGTDSQRPARQSDRIISMFLKSIRDGVS